MTGINRAAALWIVVPRSADRPARAAGPIGVADGHFPTSVDLSLNHHGAIMLRSVFLAFLLLLPLAVQADEPFQTGLCGDVRVTGWPVAEVTGEGGCGIVEPVRLASVAGVRIEGEALVSCAFARTLADWAEAPALNGPRPVVALRSSAAYVCRPVTGGAALSNHAYGMAMDVTGFILPNGREVSVRDGWNEAWRRGFLENTYAAACNRFDTVLGPDFDAAHADHFHLDLEPGGWAAAYCR
ncbi:hypothetical protein FHS89_000140 [Rubricella aquisinus]|uniref:Extensin-like C-terminal domain-containing protein n=1 Tax=Rubricella aquisinus TaxID=2028108 RepID=A0A840WKF1_9RHOB|nr:extensin family protein [Rubricella aquisinus]MBB5514142.1 hypothetical protein [Rubricella aquisinus]